MNKSEKIVEPYVYNGYVIIALHPDWIKLFQKIPHFVVTIQDHKLHLVSKEVIQDA